MSPTFLQSLSDAIGYIGDNVFQVVMTNLPRAAVPHHCTTGWQILREERRQSRQIRSKPISSSAARTRTQRAAQPTAITASSHHESGRNIIGEGNCQLSPRQTWQPTHHIVCEPRCKEEQRQQKIPACKCAGHPCNKLPSRQTKHKRQWLHQGSRGYL